MDFRSEVEILHLIYAHATKIAKKPEYLEMDVEQEKISVPSADMICGHPSSCQASVSGADSKLGLTMG